MVPALSNELSISGVSPGVVDCLDVDLPAQAVTFLEVEAGMYIVNLIGQALIQPAANAPTLCQPYAMARLIHDE